MTRVIPIVTQSRTGSTAFANGLGWLPGHHFDMELFAPVTSQGFFQHLARRVRHDPDEVLPTRLEETARGFLDLWKANLLRLDPDLHTVGFKAMAPQLLAVQLVERWPLWDATMAVADGIIFLTRTDYVGAAVSYFGMAANAGEAPILHSDGAPDNTVLRVDPRAVVDDIRARMWLDVFLGERLDELDVPVVTIDHRELFTWGSATIESCEGLLGIPLGAVGPRLSPRTTIPLEQRVENFDELASALVDADLGQLLADRGESWPPAGPRVPSPMAPPSTELVSEARRLAEAAVSVAAAQPVQPVADETLGAMTAHADVDRTVPPGRFPRAKAAALRVASMFLRDQAAFNRAAVGAVEELSAQVESLSRQVAELSPKVERLQRRLAGLERGPTIDEPPAPGP